MNPAPAYAAAQPIFYQPPTVNDPAVQRAKADELARMQGLRGRSATLLVTPAASGPDLLPASTKAGGAQLLGGRS